MGIHILSDDRQEYPSTTHAVMYCSSTDWAFGPVFDSTDDHEARERIGSFLRYLGDLDPRTLADEELEKRYHDWRNQEDAQWKREADAEDEMNSDIGREDRRQRILRAIYDDAKLWAKCWPLTDAYGEPGFMPGQGYDWSGFRDSSDDAVLAMGNLIGIK